MQMSLAKDQHMIEALASQRSDQPLNVGILPRRSQCYRAVANSHRSSSTSERRQGPPSQSWRTFLRNHADAIAAIDLCLLPTVAFECLFAVLVVGHGRRQRNPARCHRRIVSG
jgi:hypothetical protein